MGLFDRVAGFTSSLLTLELQLGQLRKDLDTAVAEMHAIKLDVVRLSERITRLEAYREADRAELAALLAQFEARVDRRVASLEQSALAKPKSLPKPKKKP